MYIPFHIHIGQARRKDSILEYRSFVYYAKEWKSIDGDTKIIEQVQYSN